MTKTEFIDIMSEDGWDTAIEELEKEDEVTFITQRDENIVIFTERR